MHAGKIGTMRAAARARSAAGRPWSKGPGRVLAVVSLVCFAICPPSLVCDSPILGFACAATWPLGSPRDSLILDYQASYTYQGAAYTHRGVDIAAPAGSAVLAPCGGSIAFCGEVPASRADGGADDGSTMTAVSIQLDDGRRLTLLPLEGVRVAAGDAVEEGQQLADLAASGDRSSQQPHLHMGLKLQGEYCNPLSLFDTLPTAVGSAAQGEGSLAGEGGSPALPSSAPAPAAAAAQALSGQAGEEEPSFGTVSSGEPVYERAAQTGPQPAMAGLSVAAGAIAAACSAQFASWLEGLGELSRATGIPYLALVFASVLLAVGLAASIVLQLMHLRRERRSLLNGKARENAPLCVRLGGDNMHKLFPAPGTSFITRGRSAQRR